MIARTGRLVAREKECVWDYPRPPRAEPTSRHLRVEFEGAVIAETRRGFRVIETSHPPVYYFPRADVALERLAESPGSSFCEWKGTASYFDLVDSTGALIELAAWTYADPTPAFRGLRDCIGFYPDPMDGCYVDGERVIAQEGGFYGGWITSDLEGPFKGTPGSSTW